MVSGLSYNLKKQKNVPAMDVSVTSSPKTVESRSNRNEEPHDSAPAYSNIQALDPVNELSRGRFGSGTLLVYDAAKKHHVVAKRVSKLQKAAYEQQLKVHARLNGSRWFVQFLGTLPSSTHCFQFMLEHVVDGNLRKLVVADVGLPERACKHIVLQLRDALDHLHNKLNIIHGDLRPEHVLISSMSHCHVKLCSFAKAHGIGACVKKNEKRGLAGSRRRGAADEKTERLRSILLHRTSSLTPGSLSFRGGKAVKNGGKLGARSGSRQTSESPFRRHSAIPPPKVDLLSDVHEYTVWDMKREITSEIFSKAFTAPELLNASRYVASPASDNWSLGIVALYVMTGATPWESASVDNPKYTAFVRNSTRSHSLSPMLACKTKRGVFSGQRSASLSSLFSSFRMWSSSDRMLTATFERRIVQLLQRDPTARISLDMPDAWFLRRWGFDDGKWGYYEDCFFDENWRK